MIDCRFILLCVSPWLLRLLGLTFMSSWTLGVFLLQWHAWEAAFGYSPHLLLKRHVSVFFSFAFGWFNGLWSLFTCLFFCCDVQRKRVTLLMAASLFQGSSIGPLIDLAIHIDPRYVLWSMDCVRMHRLHSMRPWPLIGFELNFCLDKWQSVY